MKQLIRLGLALLILSFSHAFARAADHEILDWNPAAEKLSVVPGYDGIGGDPDSAFDFVSRSIRLQLYPGALRGVRGTLISGSGNALDQSLLLAHLLNERDQTVRISRAELSEAELESLLTRYDTDQLYLEEKLATETRRLTDLAVSAPEGKEKAALEFLVKERARLMDRVAMMLEDDQRLIADHLAGTADSEAGNLAALRDQLKAESRMHYWVEIKEGETWTALDPALALPRGQSVTAGAVDSWPLEQLPDTLFHRVELTITAYFQQKDQVRSIQPLTLTTSSAAMAGLPIFLVHPEKNGAFGMGGLGDLLTDTFQKRAGLNHLPIFYIDGKPYMGDALKILPWIQGAFFQPGPPTEIAAEILTIRITRPDGTTVTKTRPIFDRAGSAQRRASPDGPWTLKTSLNENDGNQPPELQRLFAYTIDTGTLSLDYIERAFPLPDIEDSIAAVFTVAGQGEDVLIQASEELETAYLDRVVLNQYDEIERELADNEELVKAADGTVLRDENGMSQTRIRANLPAERQYQPRDFTLPQTQSLYYFQLYAEGMRALVKDGAYRGYIAEPNITSFFLGANAGPAPADEFEAPETSAYMGFDLTHHKIRMTGSGDEMANGLLAILLEQSYTEILDRTDPDDRADQLFTTHNLISRAIAEGTALLFLSDATDPAQARLPDDIRAEIEPGLADHHILIPAKPVDFYGQPHFAWYLVEKSSFAVTDFSDVFFSQAITEKHITDAQDIIKKKDTACFYRQCLQAALGAAQGVMAVVRGNVSMGTAENLVEVLQDSKACSGKIKLKIKAKQKWNTPGGREKLKHMQDDAAGGRLRTPKKDAYKGDRAKSPAQHGDPPYTPASTATEKRDWDHKSELACGGKHEKDNVWALNRGVNRSMGAIIGRACAMLCEGTQITEIVIEWLAK